MVAKSLKVVLKPSHKVFADTYLVTGSIIKSAIKAGYSKTSAHVTGSKIIRRPDVQAYLQEKANKVSEETEDLQSRVLKEFETLAFANIADFIRIDKEGLPQVDFSSATPEQLKAITSVASKRETTRTRGGDVILKESSRFNMADKQRALENLGRHLGMFKEPEQRVVVDVADRLLIARQRFLAAENGEVG